MFINRRERRQEVETTRSRNNYGGRDGGRGGRGDIGGYGGGRRRDNYNNNYNNYDESGGYNNNQSYGNYGYGGDRRNNSNYGGDRRRGGYNNEGGGYNNSRGGYNNNYNNYNNYEGGYKNNNNYNNEEGYSENNSYKAERKPARDTSASKFEINREGRNMYDLKHKDLVAYFYRVKNHLEANKFTSDDERIQFIESSLGEILQIVEDDGVEEFYKVCNDVLASSIIQRLLEAGTQLQIRKFFKHFVKRVVDLMMGKFSSFVMQTIVQAAPLIVNMEPVEEAKKDKKKKKKKEGEEEESKEEEEEELKDAEDGAPTMRSMIAQCCKVVAERIDDVIQSRNASHVLRSLITAVSANTGGSEQLFNDLIGAIVEKTNVSELAVHTTGGAVLSSILEKLPNTHPVYQKLVQSILEYKDSKDLLTNPKVKQQVKFLATHAVASHVIDTLVKSLPTQLFDELYSGAFRGTLQDFCTHNYANYFVAAVVGRATHKEQFELIFDELNESFENMWKNKAKHIIVELAAGCAKYTTKQRELMKSLLTVTDCVSNDHMVRAQFFPKICSNDRNTIFYDRFGCKLIEQLVHFNPKNIQALQESIMNVDQDTLVKMCTDKSASKAVESVLQAWARNKNTKYELIKKLMGKFAFLAKDVYGSHFVEKCIALSEVKRKQAIAQEIVDKEVEIQENPYGRIVWFRCNLDHFKRQKSDWLLKEEQTERRLNAFKDILGEEGTVELKTQKNKERVHKHVGKGQHVKFGGEDAAAAPGKVKVLDEDLFANASSSGDKKRKRGEEQPTEDQEEAEDQSGQLSNILNYVSEINDTGSKFKTQTNVLSKKEDKKKKKKAKKNKSDDEADSDQEEKQPKKKRRVAF